jgi:hypothetical protein
MTGIPQQVFVAVLDEIAAVHELKFQIAVGIGVRETLVDGHRSGGGAAVEPRKRHVRRRLRRGQQAGKSAGTGAGRQQG